jgi:hypothetical protein
MEDRRQPVSRSAGQPVSRSAGQPVSRSAGQPVSQRRQLGVEPTGAAPEMSFDSSVGRDAFNSGGAGKADEGRTVNQHLLDRVVVSDSASTVAVLQSNSWSATCTTQFGSTKPRMSVTD